MKTTNTSNPLRAATFALAALAVTVQAESTPAPIFSHPRDITSPFLPLASLKQDILESKVEHVERTARPDIKKTFTLGGQTIAALTVEDREYVAGQLVEIAQDYFAQADDGTVYYLGEDVDTYKDGKVTGHSGAWVLGKSAPTPGVLLPARPKVGDKFQSENVSGVTVEDDEVISTSETITVPAGTFHGCLKVKEKSSDGDTEYKYYAPGVGCIEEVESDGTLPLKSHTTLP